MCQIQAAPSAMYADVPSVSNVRKPDRRNSARTLERGHQGPLFRRRRTLSVPRHPNETNLGPPLAQKSEPYFQSSGTAFNVRGERLCLVPLQQLVPTFRSSRCLAAHTFTNFGTSRALARVIILVPLFDLKSQRRVASLGAGTSDRRHQKRRISLQSLCRVRNEI